MVSISINFFEITLKFGITLVTSSKVVRRSNAVRCSDHRSDSNQMNQTTQTISNESPEFQTDWALI